MIIGINGVKGAGKDTLGTYLADNYGFELLSFAALLKESFAALFDIPVEDLESLKNDPVAMVTLTYRSGLQIEMTVRTALQRYGTEAHRDVFGTDFWIEQAYRVHSLDYSKLYAWTDARFKNELLSVRTLGGINVRVDRTVAEDGDAHVSEEAPPAELIDYTLDNNRDIEWLLMQADALVMGRGLLPLVDA